MDCSADVGEAMWARAPQDLFPHIPGRIPALDNLAPHKEKATDSSTAEKREIGKRSVPAAINFALRPKPGAIVFGDI